MDPQARACSERRRTRARHPIDDTRIYAFGVACPCSSPIRLALRYGVASRVGLVVDVGDLVPLDHRDQVLKVHADWLAARPAYRKQVERLEPIMPGGLAHRDHLDEAVDASVRETINRAHAEFLEAIESPADTTLVRHWQSLGGRVPEPIGTD